MAGNNERELFELNLQEETVSADGYGPDQLIPTRYPHGMDRAQWRDVDFIRNGICQWADAETANEIRYRLVQAQLGVEVKGQSLCYLQGDGEQLLQVLVTGMVVDRTGREAKQWQLGKASLPEEVMVKEIRKGIKSGQVLTKLLAFYLYPELGMTKAVKKFDGRKRSLNQWLAKFGLVVDRQNRIRLTDTAGPGHWGDMGGGGGEVEQEEDNWI